MVKILERYEDEISGQIFDNIEDAKTSEFKSFDIQTSFDFYKPIEDECLDFANGGFCIQRSEEFYLKLLRTLLNMVNKHEIYISEQYLKKHGFMSIENIKGMSILGRFLDDNGSQLYKWWCIQSYICPKCFREYGQTYYALHCSCDNKIPIKGA